MLFIYNNTEILYKMYCNTIIMVHLGTEKSQRNFSFENFRDVYNCQFWYLNSSCDSAHPQCQIITVEPASELLKMNTIYYYLQFSVFPLLTQHLFYFSMPYHFINIKEAWHTAASQDASSLQKNKTIWKPIYDWILQVNGLHLYFYCY